MSGPSHEFISAPIWLVTFLHLFTLTLHFLAMNFLFGGLVLVLFGKIENRFANPTVLRFLKLAPTLMAATVTLGVAPLLFVQLVYAKAVYSSSIVSGWYWLSVFPTVMIAYGLLYFVAFSTKASDGVKKAALYGVLVLMALVSLIYSGVFAAAEEPELITSMYAKDPGGLMFYPTTKFYVFRALHMLFGAVTVGGFFMGWLAGDDTAGYKTSRHLFVGGMVVAIVTGLGYLISFEKQIVGLMRTPASWWLLISLLLSLGALHFFFKKKFIPCAAMMIISVYGMIVIRHYARLVRMGDSFDLNTLTIQPAWGLIVLFVLCLLIAIGAVAWMARAFMRT